MTLSLCLANFVHMSNALGHIRNFSIIAHIDHGKSTLADRLIQATNTVAERNMQEQMLDAMDIERERGITIKANTVRLEYRADDGHTYILNVIDTPGHVDFSYEVSRSMRAVEGSLLIVDTTQGVEAQTLANVYQALDADHEILPILNKIDLPASDIDTTRSNIEDVIGISTENAVCVSAKTGTGVREALEAIVKTLPAPQGDAQALLTALLVDSWYDAYLGVIVLVRIMNGVLRAGDRITMLATGAVYSVERIGVCCPHMQDTKALQAGEIGFLTASIKQVRDTRVGDTITHEKGGCTEPLAGFRPTQPVVFCGLFPVDSAQFDGLRDALAKLALNDASFTYDMETSGALGFGFRCGFLGLLHLDVVRDRIEREFNIELITTAPSVVYKVHMKDSIVLDLHNPADLPDLTHVEHIEEPRIKATVLVPDDYLGDVLKLCQERRGVQLDLTYAGTRAMVVYDLPLSEVVFDFYDRLKSLSKGYASFDYSVEGYQQDDLVKMQVLVNDEIVDALSIMVHRARAEMRGRVMCEKLKELIPRHMFKIPIQAAIGGRIIARETIAALRKDVTAKCYGGDVSRKRKLLEKQKAGKKKMRRFGKVDIPQQAFINALKMGE